MARYSDKSILEYVRIFTEKTMQVKTLPVGFFEHWIILSLVFEQVTRAREKL